MFLDISTFMNGSHILFLHFIPLLKAIDSLIEVSLYYTRKRLSVSYIFSGAATPTVFNALAKVVFTAMINARRAPVNSGLEASKTLLAL